jgi:hypothetical protein
MTTIHDAYINALLADATYALSATGPYSGNDLKNLLGLNERMTPACHFYRKQLHGHSPHSKRRAYPLAVRRMM